MEFGYAQITPHTVFYEVGYRDITVQKSSDRRTACKLFKKAGSPQWTLSQLASDANDRNAEFLTTIDIGVSHVSHTGKDYHETETLATSDALTALTKNNIPIHAPSCAY